MIVYPQPSTAIAFQDRRKDLLSGRLQTAIVDAGARGLFEEAGQIAGFRVWKVAGPGKRFFKKVEDPSVSEIELTGVTEGRQALAIEQEGKGEVDPTSFWKVYEALLEERVTTGEIETVRMPAYSAAESSTGFKVRIIARPRERFLLRKEGETDQKRVVVSEGHLGIAVIKPRDTNLDFNAFLIAMNDLQLH